jgi:hypothetical protein
MAKKLEKLKQFREICSKQLSASFSAPEFWDDYFFGIALIQASCFHRASRKVLTSLSPTINTSLLFHPMMIIVPLQL